jgi:hypothetical protein
MPAPTAVPINVVAGKDHYAYFNSATFGTPTWNAADNIQEVKLGDGISLSELKLRKNRPFKTNVPTLKDWNPTFKVPNIRGDELLEGLIAAKNNGTAIDMAFMDGPMVPPTDVTVQGMRSCWVVEKCDRNEDEGEAGMYDVSLKIAQTGNVPTWLSVTGS